MALSIITPPLAEPLVLADVKNHLRIDSDITSDDTMLTSFITAAREHGETLTGRTFITTVLRLRLDGFAQCGLGAGGGMNVIELERGIVRSIGSIHYLDMQGVQQTLDLATVAQDLDSVPARLTPKFGQVWPIPVPQIGSVWIDYTAGYGDTAAAVPQVIRQWMLVRVATLYEHRQEVELVPRGKLEPLPYIDGMLDSVRVATL
jgi:uncharacterized phiE125 gp8 family phage protein